MKDKRTIGIFFNARRKQGGLYQYALTLIHCLYKYAPEFDYSLYIASLEEFPLEIQADNWRVLKLPKIAILFRMVLEVIINYLARNGIGIPCQIIPEFKKINNDNNDVMLYVKPTPHVFQWNYRSIFPIHDLQHRLQPGFQEVSDKGEYNRRENLYMRSIAKAVSILSDSQTGKEDIMQLYQVDASKIFPLPYIAPPYRMETPDELSFIEIKHKYSLPEDYLFYPGTFWPHKNHNRLIQAIHMIMNEKGVRIPLVLTGSQSFEFPVLYKLVEDLRLQDTVIFVGYVPDNELIQLYKQALALVFPTFFGPTNIPVLEAWAASCPVITSDIRGIREQVGNAGLLVNPSDITAIAGAIWNVYTDSELRKRLINEGLLHIREWTPEKFSKVLSEIIRQNIYGEDSLS